LNGRAKSDSANGVVRFLNFIVQSNRRDFNDSGDRTTDQHYYPELAEGVSKR